MGTKLHIWEPKGIYMGTKGDILEPRGIYGNQVGFMITTGDTGEPREIREPWEL